MAGAECVTDWAATGAMLQGIGTLAGVVAVVWGAIIGANAWKNQKQAERRFEAAERILTATYKGRRALKSVRSPMMLAYEQSKAEETLKEDAAWEDQPDARKKRLITTQAYLNRLRHTIDEQAALDDCLPIARALFSEDLEKAVDKLRHQFWVVQVDAESHADDEGSDPEFTRSIHRGLYETKPRKGERNEISDAVQEAVKAVEGICQPALRMESAPKRQAAPPRAEGPVTERA